MSISEEVAEIVTITFNPSLQPSPSEPPTAYAAVAAQLKAAPGVNGVYLGRQIEQPDLWTVIIRWSSEAAYSAFVASDAFVPWLASLKAVLIDEDSPEAKALPPRQPPVMINFSGGSIDPPLSAPTTEIFSCYGVDDGFVENNLKPFADGLDGGSILGYHGLAYGGFTFEGADQPKGSATRLLIGWDSKEAHEEEKANGKVIGNFIHHVRSGRKSVDLFHVNLTRL